VFIRQDSVGRGSAQHGDNYSASNRSTWLTIIKSSAGGMTRTATGEFVAESPRVMDVVTRSIEYDALSTQSSADLSAGVDVVFSDAARENQHVHTT